MPHPVRVVDHVTCAQHARPARDVLLQVLDVLVRGPHVEHAALKRVKIRAVLGLDELPVLLSRRLNEPVGKCKFSV